MIVFSVIQPLAVGLFALFSFIWIFVEVILESNDPDNDEDSNAKDKEIEKNDKEKNESKDEVNLRKFYHIHTYLSTFLSYTYIFKHWPWTKVKIVKPKSEVPKSKVPKSRPKGLGLTLKSHGPPPPPPHHPITFKHEGVLW